MVPFRGTTRFNAVHTVECTDFAGWLRNCPSPLAAASQPVLTGPGPNGPVRAPTGSAYFEYDWVRSSVGDWMRQSIDLTPLLKAVESGAMYAPWASSGIPVLGSAS
jgi:hypothetical protein